MDDASYSRQALWFEAEPFVQVTGFQAMVEPVVSGVVIHLAENDGGSSLLWVSPPYSAMVDEQAFHCLG